MAAVWYRFRAELRARWRSALALALLAGIAGGATLAAVAGARRTDSAFSRLLVATNAADVLVNPDYGNDSGLDWKAVAKLPMVTQAGRENGIIVASAPGARPERPRRVLGPGCQVGGDGPRTGPTPHPARSRTESGRAPTRCS